MEKVVIFINMEDDVTSAIATAGTSSPASLTRAISFGKGGVGEKRLRGIHVTRPPQAAVEEMPSESLPSICNITNDVHDWPRLRPSLLP
jgi:hypothetical protein